MEALVLFAVLMASGDFRVEGAGRFPASTSRIVGGKKVNHSNYPFLVSIEYHDDEMSEWLSTCGGSIVNKVAVLTACHCATADERIHGNIKYLADPKERRIVAGTGFWKKDTPTRQIASVKKIVVHPKCQNFHNVDKEFLNDVALYFLKKPLVYRAEVQPMKLPTLDMSHAVKLMKEQISKNARCMAIGWGRTIEKFETQSEVLMGAKVNLLPPHECRKRYCNMMGDHCTTDFEGHRQMCVASPSASDCYGDSGGPLVCNGFVLGLVSYGDRCLPKLPTVYQGLQPILEILEIFHVKPDWKTSGQGGYGTVALPEIPQTGLDTDHQPKKFSEDQSYRAPIFNEVHKIRELLTRLLRLKHS